MDIAIILSLLGLTSANTGMLLKIMYEMGHVSAVQKDHSRRLERLERNAAVVRFEQKEA